MDRPPTGTLRVAPRPPMSVRTHPGQTALTRIPRGESSRASIRVRALRATFETEYADGQPERLVSPASRDARYEDTRESSAGRVSDGSANCGRRSRPKGDSPQGPLDTMPPRLPSAMKRMRASDT